MSQQIDLKTIIGDGKARVTVSKELSEKDYGNGGSVFVSVTMTCDQSQDMIDTAAGWAGFHAEKNVVEQHGQLRTRLQQLSILSP